MEDADLEAIRAKRLAQLQSQHKVIYKFHIVLHNTEFYLS
jgi:DNA-binding TFAR19-related protein (PDSD5 family)